MKQPEVITVKTRGNHVIVSFEYSRTWAKVLNYVCNRLFGQGEPFQSHRVDSFYRVGTFVPWRRVSDGRIGTATEQRMANMAVEYDTYR